VISPIHSEQLSNFLEFMQECGINDLHLEVSPFFVKNSSVTVPNVSVAPAHRVTPPVSSRSKEKPVSHQTKPQIHFNSSEIMDLAQVDLEEDITAMKSRIQEVAGESPEEILRGLYKSFHECKACGLHRGRNHFVFGEGPPDARLMFVGEGPGFDEDRTGRPFVGKAGQLLEKIIIAMGLQRSDVFIGNIVKCRPPGNRTPFPEEMRMCAPVLERQIEVIQPQVIIALGKTALTYFKQANVSIMRLRGKYFSWKGIQIMPTFHPAYILRNPAAKRDVWSDVQQVMETLNKED
jgi:DNA polymerase